MYECVETKKANCLFILFSDFLIRERKRLKECGALMIHYLFKHFKVRVCWHTKNVLFKTFNLRKTPKRKKGFLRDNIINQQKHTTKRGKIHVAFN